MTKFWIIAATALIVLGALLLVSALSSSGWDFSKLATQKLVTNSYDISRDFSVISIDTVTSDVIFASADDGKCRVVCLEEEKAKHSVDVIDGVLTVKLIDERKWHDHIGINFSSLKITVYLPKKEYSDLSVKLSTGDVDIRSDLTIESIELSATTGDVLIENVKCKALTSTGTTGNIEMKNVIADKKLSIERTTGDVELERCDGGEIFIETTTGDVEGSLLSGKMFSISSTTGDIKVPKSTSGGKCEIKVTTGDIEITVE